MKPLSIIMITCLLVLTNATTSFCEDPVKIEGIKTSIRTKVSHGTGSTEIDDSLLSLMARCLMSF